MSDLAQTWNCKWRRATPTLDGKPRLRRPSRNDFWKPPGRSSLEDIELSQANYDQLCALADRMGLSRKQLQLELKLLHSNGVLKSYPKDSQLPEPAQPSEPAQPAEPADDSDPAGDLPAVPAAALTAPVAPPPLFPDRPPEASMAAPPPLIHAAPDMPADVVAPPPLPETSAAPGAPETLRAAEAEAALAQVDEPEVLPADLFCEFLATQFADTTDSPWSDQQLKRLVRIGKKQHSLSSVYARQLIDQVAQAHGLETGGDQAVAEPQSEPETDPAIGNFIESVAPILAEYRGINARSRILLTAMSREQGLSSDQLQQALGLLQRGTAAADGSAATSGAEVDPLMQARMESFRSHLREPLAQFRGSVLSVKQYTKLMKAGVQREGLSAGLANSMIQQTAQAAGVRVVTTVELSDRIAAQVDAIIGRTGRLPANARQQIRQDAIREGLTELQADEVINLRARVNRAEIAATSRYSQVMLGISALAVVLMLLGIGGYQLYRSFRPEIVTESIPETPSAEEVVAVPAARSDPQAKPDWWDSGLEIALANARVGVPDAKPLLIDLAAEDVALREQAYQQLADFVRERAVDESFSGEQWLLLHDLIGGCLAKEPDREPGVQLRTRLVSELQTDKFTADNYARQLAFGLWCLDSLCTAAQQLKDEPAQQALIVNELESVLRTDVDPRQPSDDLRRSLVASLLRRRFEDLIDLAVSEPLTTVQMHDPLASICRETLPEEEFELLEADYLLAVVPGLGEQWQTQQAALRQLSQGDNEHAVARLLDLFKRTDNTALRFFLRELLAARLPALDAGLPPESLVREARRQLGFKIDPAAERWSRFQELADLRIKKTPATPDEPDAVLREAMTYSWLSTLGCLVAEGDFGRFDELLKAGVPKAREIPPVFASEPGRTNSKTLRQLNANLEGLQRLTSLQDRLRALSTVARLVSQLEIGPHKAQTIAEYLIRPKASVEHQQMLELVERLGESAYIRLAFADAVLESTVDKQVLETAQHMLASKRLNADDPSWPSKAYQWLLESVARRMPASDGGSDVAAAVAGAMQKQYKHQAEAAGVDLETLGRVAAVSDALRALINNSITKLSATELEDAARTWIESLPTEFEAIEWLAGGDLERTVLYQRIWLRLLAIKLGQRRGRIKRQLAELLANRLASDPKCELVVEQLRDGEQTALQMWRLLAD